ncbi:hypothetical protein JW758_03045 [Candidatus Peregrinibacteria bacterium]|nr:hypothetical protein [Candidatus Peregrinibacteria bacterium]
MTLFKNLNTDTIKDCLILLDIDGTIAEDDQLEVSDENMVIIDKLKKMNQVHLCSNSRNHKRNKTIADYAGITYLDTDIRKPSKKILDLIEHSAFTRRLVIGDKFLTDGLFAKNIKADFIKIDRITSKNDRLYIKFLYWIDNLICKIISK